MSRQLKLMPSTSLRRRAIHEARSLWLRVAIVVASIGGAVVAWEVWQCQQTAQHLAALEAQHKPVQQLASDIRVLKAKIDTLTADEQLALELASNQSMLTLVGQLGKATAYAGGDLFIESMEYERRPAAGSENATQVLNLEGAALNNLSVTRLVEHLRHSGIFRDVTLGSTASRMIAQQAAVSFQVECAL